MKKTRRQNGDGYLQLMLFSAKGRLTGWLRLILLIEEALGMGLVKICQEMQDALTPQEI